MPGSRTSFRRMTLISARRSSATRRCLSVGIVITPSAPAPPGALLSSPGKLCLLARPTRHSAIYRLWMRLAVMVRLTPAWSDRCCLPIAAQGT